MKRVKLTIIATVSNSRFKEMKRQVDSGEAAENLTEPTHTDVIAEIEELILNDEKE